MDLAENMPDLKLCCEFPVLCVLHVFPHELTQQSFQHFATTLLKRYELLSPALLLRLLLTLVEEDGLLCQFLFL